MTMEGTGIVPVMDLNARNNAGYGDGFGYGGAWFMWIFVIFALMGGWGGNWGNRGYDAAFTNGTFTRGEIADGFANQETHNGIRAIQNGLSDGFYAVNTGLLQGFNGIQRDLCQGFSAVSAGIAENRFAAQQCLTKLFKAMKKFAHFQQGTSSRHLCIVICTGNRVNCWKL